MSCFQLSCTGDSAALTMRVPICTPSRAEHQRGGHRTSVADPARRDDRHVDVFDAMSGSSTIVDAPVGALKPPPSLPSTTRPSTPASTAFNAPRNDGTTWKTVMPASFNALVNFVGSPADVVTNVTPFSATKSTMPGSRTKSCAMLTPNGLSVRSRILAISSRTSSSRPDDVSMMPRPPAFETADASCARAM